jgi:thiamine kinase-like enzyme
MGEIKKYLNELRNIKGNILGSINNGPYNNCLFQDPKPEKSFSNINQFNDYWINKVKEIMPNYHILAIKNVLPSNRDIVFSHGDLTTKNIIIKDNKIVSIIDWELAGWYPESWEYFRMLSYSVDDEKWHDGVSKIIKPYYIDYLMYKHIFACLY